MKEINVVWLKRDLRTKDHLPLKLAMESDLPCLLLYCYEPIVENNYDFSLRHWSFVHYSIESLNSKTFVHELYGEIEEIFQSLLRTYQIKNVFSYQESGNDVTFSRDIKMKRFFKEKNILWHEFQCNGVVRGLRDRKSWDAAWIKFMSAHEDEVSLNPKKIIQDQELIKNFSLPSFNWEEKQHIQAGEEEAHKMLSLFIDQKVEGYFKSLSYPDKSRYHCSLLSSYISWGNISIRQIYKECRRRRSEVKNKMSIDQYMARLKWHCHFIQKFEMEPSLEFENMNSSYNHIRQKRDKKKLKAWKQGMTGYPLIDAAMRCVARTGYLNFRLRACVVSFLTHHLWQPWQLGAGFLAREFLDYEPGIHFSQFQMQAGTVGIHTLRIYNPVKQSKEKDKDALFIKEWVPELKELPLEFIHEPWKMTEMEQMMHDFRYGRDYPKRIVDHEEASKHARDELWKIKNHPVTMGHSKQILKKHARKRHSRSR